MKDKKLREIASEKQIKLIKYIEDMLDIKFKGETQEDVYKWIGNNIEMANKCNYFERQMMALSGINVYSARHNFQTGAWEEGLNLKNTLAHEKFKGDLIREKVSSESFAKFALDATIEAINSGYSD